MTRITDIIDNRAADGFVAEHGLSLLIEHGDERILFDTGAAGRHGRAGGGRRSCWAAGSILVRADDFHLREYI